MSLSFGAILAVNIVLLLRPPLLSVVVSVTAPERAHIAWVLPGSLLWDRGIRDGDPVLSLDRHRPTQNDTGFKRVTELAVRTTSGVTRVNARALRHGHETWPLLLLSPWFFLFGTLIILRSPRSDIGLAAYLLFASAAFALALSQGADDEDPLSTVAELIAVLVFASAFARFFFLFPVQHHLGRRGWLLVVPALAAVVLGTIALFQPSLYHPISALRVAVASAYLVAGAGFLVQGFLHTRDHAVRQSILVLSASAALSILPLVALSLAPRLFGAHALVPPERAVLTLALLPSGFAYAVLRHHVFGVQFMQRWLVHGVLWSGLSVLSAVAALILLLLLPAGTGIPLIWVAVVILLISGASFPVIYRRLLSLLDRHIFKDAYDYRASLQRLSNDLSLARDLDTLTESLLATLQRLMNLRFVALLVGDASVICVRGIVGALHPALSHALVEVAHPAERVAHFAPVMGDDRPALFVPLLLGEVSVGYLCLGSKTSGEPFRGMDRDLLTTLSGHLAALIHNAQLADDLRLKVESLDVLNNRLESSQEEERARLAADVHDEPLQTALHLDRQLRSKNGHYSGDDSLHAVSRALVDQLRAICLDMRPVALEDLGLHAALDMLIYELHERSGVPITLDMEAQSLAGAVSPAVELTLYRVAQEAMNNALRHAGPCIIRVFLRTVDDSLRLEVTDNGAGFIVPDRLDQLALDGHLGLASMRQRVERAGGSLDVVSVSGHGTTVRAQVPLATAR